MIFLDKYKKLIDSTYTIFYNDNDVIVAEGTFSYYLKDDEITYSTTLDTSSSKNIINTLVKKDDIPKKLKKFLKERTSNIIGRQINLVSDKNNSSRFCQNKEFAIHYGIQSPINVTLTILDTFDNKTDFDNSFSKNEVNKTAFGLWDIEQNKIVNSFIFSHPIQTKLCFGDFGTSELNKGSLFIKMEITINE